MPIKVHGYTSDDGKIQPNNNEAGILEAASSGDLAAQQYTPTFTSSGAGVLAARGVFSAHGIKDDLGSMIVIVRGSFQFTRAVAGVAETLKMTLPTDADLAPAVNFAAATDATGSASMAGIHAATDFCGTLVASVGAKAVEVPVTDNAASSVVNVFFSYKVA